ncbi:uncharacterized protein [Notamacropus eugenii]|uniref:uncharacterized protein n=1 Tax=Notamacropus eugenii TaxID=9315 RepID=UPI003B67CD5E
MSCPSCCQGAQTTMAELCAGLGGNDSEEKAAVARNRQGKQLLVEEENYWGGEGKEEEGKEERKAEGGEQKKRQHEDEDKGKDTDVEYEKVIEGPLTDKSKEEEDKDDMDSQEENLKEEDAHLSLEALRVLERLKEMNCPFLMDFSKSKRNAAKEFLCTPSIYRLDILLWLFKRLYPPFRGSFDTWQNCNVEEKIIEMTRLGHELMLCGPDDQDLIKGYAPEKSQIYLMHELMNLVETLSSEISDKRLERSSNELNICEMMKEQKTTLLKFFSLDRSQKITASKSSSLPTEPHYGKTEHLYAKPLEAKKTKAEELNEKLDKLAEMLQAHKGQVLSRQNSAKKRFLPNVTRRTIQNVKTVSKVVNLKVEGDKNLLAGTRCVVALQSLFPKSLTNQTTSVGMPRLESE